MNNERFKQKMAALEKERDKFISKLTPESQQEYKEKEEEINRLNQFNQDEFNPGQPILPKS